MHNLSSFIMMVFHGQSNCDNNTNSAEFVIWLTSKEVIENVPLSSSGILKWEKEGNSPKMRHNSNNKKGKNRYNCK